MLLFALQMRVEKREINGIYNPMKWILPISLVAFFIVKWSDNVKIAVITLNLCGVEKQLPQT